MPIPAHQRLLLAILALASSALGADTPERIEFFEKKIRPVLVAKCYGCHSVEAPKVKGGLLLDSREAIRRGGDSGPAVVPGDAAKSLLLSAMRYEDFEMPPSGKLADEIIADFATWIASGAADPREAKPALKTAGIDLEAGRRHWSFQAVARPPIPSVVDPTWPRTDIDRFILAGLESRGLRPVADAPPLVLRRRIAFDLTGLPPTSDQPSDPAAQIAALLASPRFGERWGRHWLDVARYADSTGGGHNVLFPQAWRYRNWVIDAFNADLPYDQFVRHQLAGDLLPADSDAARNAQAIATGFLCVGVKDLRENSQQRYRMDLAEEQIDVVGRAMLGLTIACAKCHDHKFDPIPTRDYYALAGIFVSSEPLLGVRRNRQPDPFAAGLAPLAGSGVDFTAADQAAMLKLRVELTYANLKVRDARYAVMRELNLPGKSPSAADEQRVAAAPAVRAALAKAEEIRARFESLRERYDAAMPGLGMALRDDEPRDVAIHIRGEDAQLGEIVPRGFLQVLTVADAPPINRRQSGRWELAEWIASSRNPLTARVMANRVWQHLMGVGLVETPDDFGKTGQPPSNPELLDHLAQRLVAHDWSVKRLIAEIMNSRVYQLSSAHDGRAFEADPANRLHWRMNRRRLDSDAILDSLRFISNNLVLERPPPRFAPTQQDDRVKTLKLEEWLAPTRNFRTIYQPLWRDYLPDDWSVFDFPDPSLVAGKRSVTTVPTQALYWMNSPLVVEQSRHTAERLGFDPADSEPFIRAAYGEILSRPPTAEEIADAQKFLKSLPGERPARASAAAIFCQTLFASADFYYLD